VLGVSARLGRVGRAGRVAITGLVLGVWLSACADQGVGQRGFVLDEKALEQIKVGSSAEQVILVLGTPSTTSTVGGSAYYYISQKVSRPVLFMNETILDQRVVAIYLDQNYKVTRIANYGIKDGKVFDSVSRTTPTGGEDASFVGSLFRRLSAPTE